MYEDYQNLKCTRTQFIPLDISVSEKLEYNKEITKDILPITKVVGHISYNKLGENSVGAFILLKEGPDFSRTKLIFTGYDFSGRLQVTYEADNPSIFGNSSLSDSKWENNRKICFVRFKGVVFLIQIDKNQNGGPSYSQDTKLRVFYVNTMLGKLVISKITEIGLKRFLFLTRMEIFSVQGEVKEKTILIEMRPQRDSNGNIKQSTSMVNRYRKKLLKRLGINFNI